MKKQKKILAHLLSLTLLICLLLSPAFSTTVLAAAGITVTPPAFDLVNTGYTQPAAKNVTIKNTSGSGSPVIIDDITFAGDISAFDTTDAARLLDPQYHSVEDGQSASFQVQPVTGLADGTYTLHIAVEYSLFGSAQPSVTTDVTFRVIDSALSGTAPSVSTNSLTIDVGLTDFATFGVDLGSGAKAATSAAITCDRRYITASPTTLNTSGTVTVTAVHQGTTTITVTYTGGERDGQADTVTAAVVWVGTAPSVSSHSISVPKGGTASVDISLGSGSSTAYEFTLKKSGSWCIDLNAIEDYRYRGSRTVTITGTSVGKADILVTYIGGIRDGETDTIKVTVTEQNTWVQTPGSSTSTRSDSGSSTSKTWSLPVQQATEYIIDKAEMQQLIDTAQNDAGFVRSSSGLPTTVKAGAWKLPAGKFIARTVTDKTVQVQLTFPEPNKITADMKVSGWVKGSVVDSRRAFFEKWFQNKLRIVHLDHTGSFGQPVEVAASVDLTGMDTANLYFYSYDKASNSYSRIEKPDYWIDNNGYLHFTTEYAGDIVISEGPRVPK